MKKNKLYLLLIFNVLALVLYRVLGYDYSIQLSFFTVLISWFIANFISDKPFDKAKYFLFLSGLLLILPLVLYWEWWLPYIFSQPSSLLIMLLVTGITGALPTLIIFLIFTKKSDKNKPPSEFYQEFRTQLYVLSLLLCTLVIVPMLITLFNPIRRYDNRIEATILRRTPIGTHIDDVIKKVESNSSWRFHGIQELYPPHHNFINEVRPSYLIRIVAGEYRNVFRTVVWHYWWFDENGLLIKVNVRKEQAFP